MSLLLAGMHGAQSTLSRSEIAYRPDIDGLRAIAVLLVLAFHAFPDAVPAGFVGVDVFFVISGFLITGVITSPDFTFSGFYARRARRLFPALAIVIGSCLAFGWARLTPAQFESLGREAAAGVLFAPNFLFWSEAGYFDTTAATKPLLHLWSLGVEEQFYLVWPALLLMFRQRQRAFLVAVVALSFACYIYLAIADSTSAFYSPLARAWELAAGGLLSSNGRRILPKSSLATGAGIVLIALSAAFLGSQPPLIVPATLGALLVVAAGQSWLSSAILESRIPVYVGKISYPLYLWHWPILSFLYISYGRQLSTIPSCAALLASVLLAILTHQLIENPFMRRMRLRTSAPAAIVLLAATGSFGIIVLWSGGRLQLLPGPLRAALAYEHYDYLADANSPGCWLPDRVKGNTLLPMCVRSRPDAIAIWGDSHAARLSTGLRLGFGAERISQLTRNACPPVLDRGEKACSDGNDYFLNIIRSTPQQTVILFGAWLQYAGLTFGPGSEGAAKLSKTIAALKGVGTENVILVGPAPKFNVSLPAEILRDWNLHKWERLPDRLVIGRDELDAVEVDLSRIAAESGIQYVSLLHTFCNDQGCLIKTEGSASDLITGDYGHFTTAGARIATSAIEPFVPAETPAPMAISGTP